MIKLIIFDFDGPILDSFEAARSSVYQTCRKLKLPLPKKESFILSWGYPGMDAVKGLIPNISDKTAEAFISDWAKNEKRKKLPLVKDALNSLKKIKQAGYFTALITSRCHNLKLCFADFGSEVKKYFDFFQSFDNPAVAKEKVHPDHLFHPRPKNHPDFFENLFSWAKEKNISLAEMVFIDDTLSGLKLSCEIGLKFLGVCTGPLDSRARWQKYGNLEAKYVINSIADLPGWLEKN